MLKGVPAILSPELLKVLCEMGHGDRICIGDGNFPGRATAQQGGCVFLRADGQRAGASGRDSAGHAA